MEVDEATIPARDLALQVPELVARIWRNVDAEDLNNVRRVCRRWYNIWHTEHADPYMWFVERRKQRAHGFKPECYQYLPLRHGFLMRDGLKCRFSDAEQLQGLTCFRFGVKHGVSATFQAGFPTLVEAYRHGKRHGWQISFVMGQVIRVFHWHDGVAQGLGIKYFFHTTPSIAWFIDGVGSLIDSLPREFQQFATPEGAKAFLESTYPLNELGEWRSRSHQAFCCPQESTGSVLPRRLRSVCDP